ncbi:hypothetical protein ACLB2K_076526 [Fragaria x ananassa]
MHCLEAIFVTRSGSRAFLFAHTINVVQGPKEDRQLITGSYTVADVHCGDCRVVLGCKYVKAYDELHKYKEGKYCIAMFNIVKANW